MMKEIQIQDLQPGQFKISKDSKLYWTVKCFDADGAVIGKRPMVECVSDIISAISKGKKRTYINIRKFLSIREVHTD